ncbi:MAG: MerR family transcriptional regulator [Firmicutes bacterium]|nr:MerR family transcriptional regulator [Bacillota bacterium]
MNSNVKKSRRKATSGVDIMGFTTSDVVKYTGLSRRQLAYWDKTGAFKPSQRESQGRGSPRVYSYLDLVQLRVLKKLLDAGMSRRNVRRCLGYLRDTVSKIALASGQFIVVGNKPLMVAEPGKAIDLARGGQLVWLIGLDAVIDELKCAVRKRRAPIRKKAAGVGTRGNSAARCV